MAFLAHALDDVLKKVEAATGIGRRNFMCDSRYREHVEARWLAMYALHKQGYTTVDIGSVMNRDHSTVVHALKMVKKLRNNRNSFRLKMRAVR